MAEQPAATDGEGMPTERDWLEGRIPDAAPSLSFEAAQKEWQDGFDAAKAIYGPCGCSMYCGDDGAIDGPGTCKGLATPPAPPLVEIVLVPR